VGYSELPIGLALLVCDTVIEDRRTLKKSLVGLFSQINVGKLPYVHPGLFLFVSLTGGTGEYPCEIVCEHVDSAEKVFALKCKVAFKTPYDVAELVFALRALRFTQAGRYWIKVLVEGMPLMMRPLVVTCRPPAPPPGATDAGQRPAAPPPPPSPPQQ
jgi:hypothetical protein